MDYKNKPNTNLICALSGCYYSPLSSLERILKVGLWDSSPVHLSTVGGQGGEERFALSTLLGSASCSAFRVKTPSWFPLGNIEKTVTVLPSVGDGGCWRGRLSHLLHAGTNLLATKAGGGGDCSSSWICSLKSKSRPTDPLLPLRCAFQQIIEIHEVQNTNSVLHIKEIDAFGAKCKREKETL